MGQAELLIAGLLVAVAGLSTLARFLSVPYPIVLVVGGALLGFTPGLPEVGLDPEVVLVVFLPPLLYGSSIYANFGDLRANLRALTLSTVGLVLATMCAVAWAAHALIPGLPWEGAFVLGAIVRRPAQRARRVGARWRLVMAWSGMRGAVSLAVALALPLTTHAGGGFPERDLIVFLTFAVIFFTLVVQGLSLPALIRRLGVSDGGADADEEIRARLIATKAAIEQIDALAGEEWTRDETVERMRAVYEYRKRRFAARAGKIEDDGYEDRSLAYQQMVQVVLGAQREALLRMRSEGELSNEGMNRILRELDLEESRLEI